MIPVLTPEEMGAVDAAAPEPVEVLIERAGAAVAHHCIDLLGGGYGRRVIVLAGKGNNGADGRAAARRLRRRGAHVAVIAAAEAPSASPRSTWSSTPPTAPGSTASTTPRTLAKRRCWRSTSRAVWTASLVRSTGGRCKRPGRSPSPPSSRASSSSPVAPWPARWWWPTSASPWAVPPLGSSTKADVVGWIPTRPRVAHKWQAAVLVVAGSPGLTGAAHLTASSAQRAGAGMVRLGTPGLDDDSLRPIEATGLALPAGGWAEVALAALDRFGALAVGPGLGTGDGTSAQVRALLAGSQIPAVVDGDALTALGSDVADVLSGRPATVLTPHDGEFDRLAGGPPEPDRLAAARRLATAAGTVVLLKGSTTVVAQPDGRVRLVTTGDARLATAGTGDVLTGVIAALLAAGADPFDAAAAGAWLHGRAGRLGPALGLVASDLLDRLPLALAEATS